MAKITLTGDALVIKSAVKMEDWKLVEKYRPESLTITDEEGNQLFKVGLSGTGGISDYGITFTGKTHDENGYATLTQGCKIVTDKDIKEELADYVGSAILKLNELENKIPDIIEEIKSEKIRIMNNITID